MSKNRVRSSARLLANSSDLTNPPTAARPSSPQNLSAEMMR